MNIVHCSVYKDTMCKVQCTLFIVHCPMFNVLCDMYIVQYTLYYNVHCALCTVECPMYNVHCTMHEMYTPHTCVQVRSSFINNVKEAGYMKHRGAVMQHLLPDQHTQLWRGVHRDKFDDVRTAYCGVVKQGGSTFFCFLLFLFRSRFF